MHIHAERVESPSSDDEMATESDDAGTLLSFISMYVRLLSQHSQHSQQHTHQCQY